LPAPAVKRASVAAAAPSALWTNEWCWPLTWAAPALLGATFGVLAWRAGRKPGQPPEMPREFAAEQWQPPLRPAA